MPALTEEDKSTCEGLLSIDECKKVPSTFKKHKTPGNDGIPVGWSPIEHFGQYLVPSWWQHSMMGGAGRIAKPSSYHPSG